MSTLFIQSVLLIRALFFREYDFAKYCTSVLCNDFVIHIGTIKGIIFYTNGPDTVLK